MGVSFELLTRPDCHLCDQMKSVLEDVLPRFGLHYAERNVGSDPALLLRFGEVVPVLLRDGRPVAKIRLDSAGLERIILRRR